MRIALVNPPWSYDNSIYFGCREPHLPLELGYAKALLETRGHQVLLLDGHLFARTARDLCDEIEDYEPSITVVTTAPSYLFWRCAPPELSVPRTLLDALGSRGGRTIAVGPHASATPAAALRKLGADFAVLGECEEAIAACADADSPALVPGVVWLEHGRLFSKKPAAAPRFRDSAALEWPQSWIDRHHHHHHRFDRPPDGPGAEVEASRGCPYACSFCAKIDYRDAYRRRDLGTLLGEIDALIAQGVTYLYFIDEIFLPWRELLEALAPRRIAFGVQTRIDLWKTRMLDRLGEAGCVSIEAGVESLTAAGRAFLDKNCRLSTEALTERLIYARRRVPFVQANLIGGDDPIEVADWRRTLERQGVWANDPVPLFPYPSSPEYRRLWGPPDDRAWERAHDYYLAQTRHMSDIQDQNPLPLAALERACPGA